MLPKRHFDLVEKEAQDIMRETDASHLAHADLSKTKKVTEIKDNTVEKSTKSSADEYEDEYDYNYDDDNDNNDSDEVVSITPSPESTTKRTFHRIQNLLKSASEVILKCPFPSLHSIKKTNGCQLNDASTCCNWEINTSQPKIQIN